MPGCVANQGCVANGTYMVVSSYKYDIFDSKVTSAAWVLHQNSYLWFCLSLPKICLSFKMMRLKRPFSIGGFFDRLFRNSQDSWRPEQFETSGLRWENILKEVINMADGNAYKTRIKLQVSLRKFRTFVRV